MAPNKPDACTVLVIDDEPLLRDGAEEILRRMRYRVFKAGRGEAGLDIFRRETPGIVLLDIKMPDMDGMEALEHIMAVNRTVKVVMVTGFATVEIAVQAMKLGAFDFISKPYEPNLLRNTVHRAREALEQDLNAASPDPEKPWALSDLITEQNRLLSIVHAMPDGVLVTDREGKAVLLNPAFRAQMGIGPELGPGEPVEALVSDPELRRRIRNIDHVDLPSMEIVPRKGVCLLARIQPMRGENGEVLGAVVNLADVSAMRFRDTA